MGQQHSNQQFTPPARAASPSAIESSPDEKRKLVYPNEFTTIIIGWILRVGVIFSATIILIGFLLLLITTGVNSAFNASIGVFSHTLGQVWSGLLVLSPQAIIATGLLLLIVTPVITVTTSIVAFAFERDHKFVVIGCVVLAILITSMLIGKGGG